MEEDKEHAAVKHNVAPNEFVGNMQTGIAYIQMMYIILVTTSAIFVWWTKHEVIFPGRSAPKFVFDFGRAILITPYVMFWS